MSPQFEFKWTKVSPAKLGLYQDLIDYFFDDDDISFRCVVIPDKAALSHGIYKRTHDDWYYQMYFKLLKYMVNPNNKYQIYLDIKDTRSKEKVARLHDVLCDNSLDFSRNIIQKVQQVRSHEVALVQLSDLLIGAISYKARKLESSLAKQEIVDRIIKRSRYSLSQSTLPNESKFNIFVWQAD